MGNSGRRKKKTNAEMPFAEKRSGEQRALSSEERGMRQGRERSLPCLGERMSDGDVYGAGG
jgi:hypothetical protein